MSDGDVYLLVLRNSIVADNPCPQMGKILTVRLSEQESMEDLNEGGSVGGGQRALCSVETYFQMNYETGEWKRLRKLRPITQQQQTNNTPAAAANQIQ